MNVLVEGKGSGSTGREHQVVLLDIHAVGSPSAADIKVQLEALRQSRTFGGSGRLISFLSYLVEETIEGRGGGLRETAIGNAVYQRNPPYDPRIDSTVRVEARRLRKKLQQYFDSEGKADPVILIVPVGSYIPRFSINTVSFRPSPAPCQSGNTEAAKSKHMSVAVFPFRALSSRDTIADFSESLAEEIIHVLGSAPDLDVRSRLLRTTEAPGERFDDYGVFTSDMLVQGSIKERHGDIQVTVELSDAAGTLIFSDRFFGFLADTPQLEAKIARTLLERLRPKKASKHRDPKVPHSAGWRGRICRARSLADRQTEASLGEAASIYEDLFEVVPFVGQSGIVDCCSDLFRIGALDREQAIKRVERAMCASHSFHPVLNPDPAASFVMSAWLGGQWPTSIDDIKDTFPQNGDSRALRIHGLHLAGLGLPEQAERQFAEAREIEPFSEHQDILEAFARYQSRIYKPQVGLDPGSIGHGPQEAVYYSALTSYFAGDVERARALAEMLRREVLGNPSLFYAREELNALLGRPQDAQRIMQSPRAQATYFAKATIASALRDPLLTVENLSRSVASREFASRWIKTDRRFDWLQGTPEYETCAANSDIRWL